MMIRRSLCAVAAALAFAQPAAAQLSSPSAEALGMGDNYTGAARGFSAIAWNPALLGLHGNPGSSFQFATVRGLIGLDPVTLSDIADWGGKVVPTDIKTSWLGQITTEGSQQGTSGFDANWLSLQFGRFGLQASTSGRAVADLSPGVAEFLMFGNADASGNARSVDFSGSTIDMNLYSTAAAGYAMPFEMSGGKSRISIGVTAKYTMGHVMATSDRSVGGTTASPLGINVGFPIVHTPIDSAHGDVNSIEKNSGSGFGLDVGVAFESGKLSVGAVVQNVMNSFEWDADKLYFSPGRIFGDKDSISSNTDSRKLSEATGVPQALRDRVADLKFKPVIAAGVAYRVSSKLRATGDVRMGSADGMQVAPKSHIGAGLEYRLLSWLPLRVGGAVLKLDDEISGSQIGGGLGIDLGGFNIGAAAQRRSTDLGHDTILMLTLVSRGM